MLFGNLKIKNEEKKNNEKTSVFGCVYAIIVVTDKQYTSKGGGMKNSRNVVARPTKTYKDVVK